MPYKIQMRRGPAAEWTAANPTPSAGEICVEIDTLKVKVGNGTDAWADLAYLVGGGGGGVTDHGALTGLGDDDHTQYLKVDGTRALTGDLSVTEGKKIDGVDISAHDTATTGVHGVGVGTIAKVGDIATDGNLSAAAQDAVAKRHAEAHTLSSHSTRAHSELTGIGATDHHSNANDPSAGEKAALPGTSGTPGADNKYVTNADSRNSDARTPLAHSLASHSSKAHSELTGVGATDHHSNANDPGADEKAALAGTSGTPSGTNKYVTNADSRNSDARTPTSHVHAATDITTGSLDGDRLAAPTSTKRGGVKPTGTPSGKFLKDDDTWDTPAGGSPGGSDSHVQYNNGGAFGGEASLSWDDVNKRLGVGTAAPTVEVDVLAQATADVSVLARLGATNKTARVRVQNDSAVSGTLSMAGTTTPYSSFGVNRNAAVFLEASSGGLVLGTNASGSVTIGCNNTAYMTLKYGNLLGIGTDSPTTFLDVNSDVIRLRTAKTPATAGATGNQGDICWDTGYIYVCVATNTWKRTAIATW